MTTAPTAPAARAAPPRRPAPAARRADTDRAASRASAASATASASRAERARATLRGVGRADPSGPAGGQAQPHPPRGGRCLLYSASRSASAARAAGGRVNFSIGDRQDWSYLLPKRLGKGPLRARRDRRRQGRQPRRARPRAQPGGVLRPMRRALVIALAVAALAAPAAAPAAQRRRRWWSASTRVLRDAAPVKLATSARVKVGGRRCAVGRRDAAGACSPAPRCALRCATTAPAGAAPRDAGGAVRDADRPATATAASDGWVYKVGRKAGTAGAGDPPARSGRRGCAAATGCCGSGAAQRAGGCQRTLEVTPRPHAPPRPARRCG